MIGLTLSSRHGFQSKFHGLADYLERKLFVPSFFIQLCQFRPGISIGFIESYGTHEARLCVSHEILAKVTFSYLYM
jgi:hypothetical protein